MNRSCLKAIRKPPGTVPSTLRFSDSLLILAVLVVVAGFIQPAYSDEPKRLAFLIGIDAYEHRGFDVQRCAESDVKALAKELTLHQFKVVTLTGSMIGPNRASLNNIEQQIESGLVDVGKNDIVIVGLFGNGRQIRLPGSDDVTAFFCPVDAFPDDPKSMIDLSKLLETTLGKHGSRNIVLIDACRNIEKTPDDTNSGIDGRFIKTPENTAVFFSCRAGQRSYEDAENLQHGVFTYALVKTLHNLSATGKSVRWFEVVKQAYENFDLLEIEDAIPRESVQEMVLAGNLNDFVFSTGKGGIATAPSKLEVAQNMTGLWQGKQQHRAGSTKAPIDLTFAVIQQGELISGFVRESYTTDAAQTTVFFGMIDGRINGDVTLSINKSYEGNSAASQATAQFRGKLSANGTTFNEGSWTSSSGSDGVLTLERINTTQGKEVTGIWHGTYFYPAENRQPPVDFTLFAVQSGPTFIGFLKEPRTFGENDTAWLYATVSGEFDESTRALKFTKTYDGTGKQLHAVEYQATLSSDGRKMADGDWNLGELKGRFVLQKCLP